MSDNLIVKLFDQKNQFDQKIAYCSEDDSITFSELKHQSFCAAQFFYDQGIRPRQVVALYCNDSVMLPVVWCGLILLGAVPLSIPVFDDLELLNKIVTESNTKFIVVDDFIPSTNLTQIILNKQTVFGTKHFDQIYHQLPNDEIFLNLSSGTSGERKIISQHRNQLYETFAETPNPFDLTENSCAYLLVKLTTGWGITAGLIGCLAVRYSVFVSKSFDSLRHVDQILKKHKITHVMLFPKALSFIYDYFEKLPDTLERIYVAGEPSNPEFLNNFQKKFNVDTLDNYGCSEVRCWAVLISHRHHRKFGSLGVPGPGIELRLVDNQNNQVPVGQPGQLVIKHSEIFNGYKNNKFKSTTNVVDGWFYTQDIMKMDSDGFYYYLGRIETDNPAVDRSSVLKIESTIENILASQEVIVSRDNENTIAFVIKDLSHLVDSRIHNLVDKLFFVTKIPRTSGTNKKIRNIEELKKHVA